MAFNEYPKRMVIEPTTRCNLRCIHCARHVDSRKKGDMPKEIFNKLLPIMGKVSQHVILSGNGEPFLNKDFMYMVEKVKQHAPAVGFITNGTLLNEKNSKRLVELEADTIEFSVDAASPELFKRIRKGSELHQALNAISLVKKFKQKAGSDKPFLGISFVAMKMNISELPALVKLAASLGVESVSVSNLNEYPLVKGESLVGRYEQFNPYFYEAFKVAKTNSVDLVLKVNHQLPLFQHFLVYFKKQGLVKTAKKAVGYLKPPRKESVSVRACSDPWETTFVRWNGDIIPCCGMEKVMGNLEKQGFEEIWFGDAYQKLRKRVASNNPPLECIECPKKRSK